MVRGGYMRGGGGVLNWKEVVVRADEGGETERWS